MTRREHVVLRLGALALLALAAWFPRSTPAVSTTTLSSAALSNANANAAAQVVDAPVEVASLGGLGR